MTFKTKHFIAAAALSFGLSATAYAESCADTDLYANMETLADNMRPLVQAVRGGDMDEAQARLETLRAAAADAADETPYSLRDGGSQADIDAFQDAMNEMVERLDRVEVALA